MAAGEPFSNDVSRNIDGIKDNMPVYLIFGKKFKLQDVTVDQLSGLSKYGEILSKGAFDKSGKVSEEFKGCVITLVGMAFADFPTEKLFDTPDRLGIKALMTLLGNIMDDLLGEQGKN